MKHINRICFALCITLFYMDLAAPANSPFNAKRLANKLAKRGNVLRKAVTKESVRYFLYSNVSDLEQNHILRMNDEASLKPYDVTKPLTVIIHGFQQNSSDKHPQDLKNANNKIISTLVPRILSLLQRKEPSNIVIVGWQSVSLPFKNPHTGVPLSTREAQKNVQRVSKHIGEMITYLRNESKLSDANDCHLIGYGLGAQIAGVVGFRVKQVTGESIGRITGLDPSGPQQTERYTALSEKLDKTDANFVDVIHTANGPFGPAGSIGHVDFFPNGGGPTQPECVLPVDPKRDLEGFPGSCSSALAWDYYMRSIIDEKINACEAKSFVSFKLGNGCEHQIKFGHHVSTSARGDYFLSIRSQEQA